MESDERAIRDVHAIWIDAVNAADLERLLGLMTDDAVFLSPGRPPQGRHEFPFAFSDAHRQFRIRCISELQEVAVVGDFAYTRCQDSLSMEPRAGGATIALAGHRITVYRKLSDGRWLLARDAHTLSAADAPISEGSSSDGRLQSEAARPTDDSRDTSAGQRAVLLQPMSDAAFAEFVDRTVPSYAAEKVASGQWHQEQSLELARSALQELLPQGRTTAGHHLFTIADSAGSRVGTLWFAETERAGKRIAYLYDLWVVPEFRRHGYAARALKAAEAEAGRIGLLGIGLHVFGHNAGARLLYERLGYRTTNLNMFKSLC